MHLWCVSARVLLLCLNLDRLGDLSAVLLELALVLLHGAAARDEDLVAQRCDEALVVGHDEQAAAACTFQPSRLVADHDAEREEALLQPNSLYEGNVAWGTDDHVRRYEVARLRRVEQKEYEEAKFRAKDSWRPQRTVPKPFELGRSLRGHKVKSLESDFSGMAAQVRRNFNNEPSAIEAPSVPPGLFSASSTGAILEHSPSRARPDRGGY